MVDFSQNVCAASCLKVSTSDLQLNVFLCDGWLFKTAALSSPQNAKKTVFVASYNLNVEPDSAFTSCQCLYMGMKSWRPPHAEVTEEQNQVLQGSVKQ